MDAHHYDWFQPYEIRECHGNVELYQCSFGRARCGPGLWRAPRSFRFAVEPGSLLAFAGPAMEEEAEERAFGAVIDPEDSGTINIPLNYF